MIKPSAIVIGVGAERGLDAALCRRFAQGAITFWSPGGPRPRSTKLPKRSFPRLAAPNPIVTDATLEQQMFGTKFPV